MVIFHSYVSHYQRVKFIVPAGKIMELNPNGGFFSKPQFITEGSFHAMDLPSKKTGKSHEVSHGLQTGS